MAYSDFRNGLNILTKAAVDRRILLTKQEMKNAFTLFPLLPDVYFAVCSDDGKLYLYNSATTPSAETGKFTLIDEQIFNNTRFTTLETKVGDAEHGLVKDVTQLQSDVTVLQTDVTQLQTDVTVLKQEVEDPESGLGKRIQELEGRLDTAEERMTEIEERIASIKLENIPGKLDGGLVTGG